MNTKLTILALVAFAFVTSAFAQAPRPIQKLSGSVEVVKP